LPSTSVFICSTPEELDAHQAIAYEVVKGLGLTPLLRDASARLGRDAVTALERQIAGADLVLAIVGWRRGPVPPPLLGGDGLRPWLHFELRAAFRADKSVAAMMADESFEPELRELEARSRAVMADLRGELASIATAFGGDAFDGFEALLWQKLESAREASSQQLTLGGITAGLRSWSPPSLPDHPYPLLLPYHHPDQLAGRDAQVDELIHLLESPVAITGLHAPSGTGKSSLLAAGLVPRLRAAGRAVAFDHHPTEPGLAERLIDDLLISDGRDLLAEVPERFRLRLRLAAALAGSPPILVVDQVDDLFQPAMRHQRARLGILLASSIQRQSSLEGPQLRWLLAYRREFHGPLVRWLENVLADAQAENLAGAADLPHDLSGGERFQEWALEPLGAPAPGARDPLGEASRIFAAAIEKPLRLVREDGSPRYPYAFAGEGAQRLARVFAEARLAQPRAPLAPELQVVLAHLLSRAPAVSGTTVSGAKFLVEVPADPGPLLASALEEHLRRALEAAFPGHSREAQTGRTRALLALRELADVEGRRVQGLSADLLARAIGLGGKEVLARLATAETRLVVPEEHPEGGRYRLAHDRLAEVLVRITDDRATDLGFDQELIGLRQVVTLESALFEAGEPSPGTLPERQIRAIAGNAAALLFTPGQERWWQSCLSAHRQAKRQRWAGIAVAGALVLVVALLAGNDALRRGKQQTLLARIDHGEPAAALPALLELKAGPQALLEEGIETLLRRPQPYDVLERGLEGFPGAQRGSKAVEAIELLLPRIPEGDPNWIAALAWLLDFQALPDPELQFRARELRRRLLAPLQARRPTPSLETWQLVSIPPGTFAMGRAENPGHDTPDLASEMPRHQVELSGFRMLDHEITNGEYRLLVPQHPGEENMPATGISWYEAYTFAAWLGGRLPSEAEWEYAIGSGCKSPCGPDGQPRSLDEVAWWIGNALDPTSGELILHPVKQREKNAWGLYDLYGNANEWTADWYAPYPATPQKNPPGPAGNANRARTFRGFQALPTYRSWESADFSSKTIGFRVVWSP